MTTSICLLCRGRRAKGRHHGSRGPIAPQTAGRWDTRGPDVSRLVVRGQASLPFPSQRPFAITQVDALSSPAKAYVAGMLGRHLEVGVGIDR
jgi:hypothetical protein